MAIERFFKKQAQVSGFKGVNSAWDILSKPFGIDLGLDIGSPETPPPTPTMAEAQGAGDAARRAATGGGRASTILTGPQGVTAAPTLASRALFGPEGSQAFSVPETAAAATVDAPATATQRKQRRYSPTMAETVTGTYGRSLA